MFISKAVIIGLSVCIVALVFALLERDLDAKVAVDCMDPTERENIRGLTLQAINDGFSNQIKLLFEVWMKDPNDQPRRAMVGTNNAVNAHIRARKQALAWDPPSC